MITINFDFTTGKEISFIEGKNTYNANPKLSFQTNVLTFFSFDYDCEVKVLKKDGSYILKSELLGNNPYTLKEIRISHNIYKLLVSGLLEFKKDSNV